MQLITTRPNEILVMSSYPSRECGIATFSKDLVDALSATMSRSYTMSVCALENGNLGLSYPQEVKYILNCTLPSHYYQLSEKINNDVSIEALLIQHEFGLFGGEYGEWLVSFLQLIKKPVIITFHTVLPNPEDKRKEVVQQLIELSAKVIVMTNHSSKILIDEYETDERKIEIIPHGTHPVEHCEREDLKDQFGYQRRLVASTFGLLSSNKGIENALNALPELVKNYPDILYLIVGKTHPEVIKHEGEKYRNFLEQKVVDLGLEKNVQFVNRFLSNSELLDFLQMSDIYLFTSIDKNQAVSGTFSYALSCGCPIIATAIPHAKEMLCSNTGILIDFDATDQLKNALKCLIENKAMRDHMSKHAIHKTKANEWKNVAIKYAHLFKECFTQKELKYDLPPITLKHVQNMTREFGMIQFSKINIPDMTSGYTLDDNARALIAVSMEFEQSRNLPNLPMIDKYLKFIGFCQHANGLFFNYINENGSYDERNLLEDENLEDSNGRAIWALGTVVGYQKILPQNFVTRAEIYLKNALPWIKELKSPRAIAFCIKGLYMYNLSRQNGNVRFLIHVLATKLEVRFCRTRDDQWEWFEDCMTYGNSILPESMLLAHLSTKNLHFKNIAKMSFDFLLSQIFINGKIKVISNNGWLYKGIPRCMEGGEQPIDVAYTVQTLHLFSEVYKDEMYNKKMEHAFSWFLGNNHLKQMIYNPLTGGCHDGLEKENVNLNQGAESTVCYLMARMSMERVRKGISLIPVSKEENYLLRTVALDAVKVRINN